MDTSYSYDLTYAYQSGAGHRFQLDNVRDLNYHTEETPSESTTVNNGHRYEYDANGNLIYVNTSHAISVDYDTKYALQQQVIKDNYEAFEVPYNVKDNNDYVNGQSFCCEEGTPKAMQSRAGDNFHDKDAYEKLQFYYHPDHLGSSSYITNLDGEVVQHIEYVPFGEVFIEERNNTWDTPYLFNAKELDEETGLYYYGARYYDPRLSLWMSTDPLQEKYPATTSYCYVNNNPIRFVDPTGLDWVEGKDGDIIWRKEVNADNYNSILSKDEIYRGQSYTRDKIWLDINVKGNSESGLMTEYYLPSGKMKYKNNTPWIDVAVEEMNKNISESGMNPEILKYFDYTQLKGTSAAKTDKTPWYAAFANYCVEIVDIDGTNNATAFSFKQWGQSYPKSEPKFGAIAIMSYSYVGFVVGINSDDRIILLGGNQNDAVNLSTNLQKQVVKYVYPNDYNPTELPLPKFNMKGRSLNVNSSR